MCVFRKESGFSCRPLREVVRCMWRGEGARMKSPAAFQIVRPLQLFRSMTDAPLITPYRHVLRRHPPVGDPACQTPRVRLKKVSPSPTFTSSRRQHVRTVEIRMPCLQRSRKKSIEPQASLQWVGSSRLECQYYGFKKCIQHKRVVEEGQARPNDL